jgi:hypothetical protein
LRVYVIYINTLCLLARKPTTQRSNNASSVRPHPYPQVNRKVRLQAPGRAQNMHANANNNHERDQTENEPDQAVEPDPELEEGLEVDQEVETDLDVTTRLDLLALVNKTKVWSFCIEYAHIRSQLSES